MQRTSTLDLPNTPSYVLDNLAKSARSSGNYSLAEKLYRTLLARDPNNRQAQTGLALTLADSRGAEPALKLLRDWLAALPTEDAEGHRLLTEAQNYILQRQIQQTEARYQANLELARAGRPRDALPYLREQLKQHPDATRYRYDLITVLGWAGEDQEALRLGSRLDRPNTILCTFEFGQIGA